MQYIKLKHWLIATAGTLLCCASCQKVVDLKLNNAAAQLVIEGDLNNIGGRQVVKISKSVPFTSTNIFPAVSGALVSLSDDGGKIYNFTEDTLGTYASSLKGLPGKTYTLTVQVNGKIYTAQSTMPQPIKLDSISSRQNQFNKKKRSITAHYADPVSIPNQYRFVMYVNGMEVNNIFANDDNFIDGQYVHEDLFQNATDILPGDKVTVEMQCIDPAIFTYWFSLEQQQSNNPGGGTAPSNPPSNFNNNALGYFSAHTSERKSIVVK